MTLKLTCTVYTFSVTVTLSHVTETSCRCSFYLFILNFPSSENPTATVKANDVFARYYRGSQALIWQTCSRKASLAKPVSRQRGDRFVSHYHCVSSSKSKGFLVSVKMANLIMAFGKMDQKISEVTNIPSAGNTDYRVTVKGEELVSISVSLEETQLLNNEISRCSHTYANARMHAHRHTCTQTHTRAC